MSKTPAIDLNSEIQLRCNRRLVQGMQRLQKDKSFHDVNLIYPNSVERIPSVKKLLSTHSDYFKTVFLCKGKGPYNDQELNLPFSEDIPISIFKMLHNYIFIPYLDVDSISLEDQIKLFRLSKYYQFGDVTHFMVKYFILKMSADICWELLNLSAELTEERLGDECAQVIAHLPNSVTNSKFLGLNEQTLEFLLRRSTLTLQEGELIKIKKAWNEYNVVTYKEIAAGYEDVMSPQPTKYKSFEDILRADNSIDNMKTFNKLIEFKDSFFENGLYSKNFEQLNKLGEGAFGSVFKVKLRDKCISRMFRESEYSAIKRIKFTSVDKNEMIKEFHNYKKMRKYSENEYLVKCFNTWFEESIVSNQLGISLYIEMELCDQTLRDVIKEFDKELLLKTNSTLTTLGYYIAGQISIQILEGVNYLHKQNPSLIHRDLKPHNILLKKSNSKKNCVKIADFGPIRVHEFSGQSKTRNQGTFKYMASEAMGSNCNTEVDVYSLGLIFKELFSLEVINSNDEIQRKCFELCTKMAQPWPHIPPNCEDILNEKSSWALNKEELEINDKLENIIALKESKNKFTIYSILRSNADINFLLSNNTIKTFEKLIEFKDSLVKNCFYSKNFEQLNELGKGSFGTVFMVQRREDNDCYRMRGIEYSAIKRIEFTSVDKNEIIREYLNYKTLTRNYSENKYLVKHFDAWFEENVVSNQSGISLFIQMELCDKTLSDVIKEFDKELHLKTNGMLTTIGYYIASNIFLQILEGVNHLHKQNPPIIHRNLKPENILLIKDESKGICVKIADTGLITIHDYTNKSHTRDRDFFAPENYMAPEVFIGRNYKTKSDIYSLGVIFRNLFTLDSTNSYDEIENISNLLKSKYKVSLKLCSAMTVKLPNKRPNCEEILKRKTSWALIEEEFEIDELKRELILKLLDKN